MTNRLYRLLVGLVLLIGLYFDMPWVIDALIVILFVEGITNWRVPTIVNTLLSKPKCDPNEGSLGIAFSPRCIFEAERAWRLTVGTMLTIGFVLYYPLLWFLPWFMGFAIFGAGVSGVCPVFLLLKWAGFK